MSTRQRLSVIGLNVGLALLLVGIFLPWARVAGELRSAPRFANTLLGLPDIDQAASLPGFGLFWYTIPLLALAEWVSQFAVWPPSPGRVTRWLGAALLLVMAGFYVFLVGRGVGGPQTGANLSIAGAAVAAVSPFIGRVDVEARGSE